MIGICTVLIFFSNAIVALLLLLCYCCCSIFFILLFYFFLFLLSPVHMSSRQEGLEQGRAISAYSIEGSRALQIADTLLTLTPVAAMVERLYPYPGPYLGYQSISDRCLDNHLLYSHSHSSSKHSHSEKVDQSQTPNTTTNTNGTANITAIANATTNANTNTNMHTPISPSGNKPASSSTSAKSDTNEASTTMTRGNQPRLRAFSHSSSTPTARRLVSQLTYHNILMHSYPVFFSSLSLSYPLSIYLSYFHSVAPTPTAMAPSPHP